MVFKNTVSSHTDVVICKIYFVFISFLWGVLSGGFLARGVFVQGVFVRGLCPGGFCLGFLS